LISVASRAAELFERSKTEQKRELLAFVFSNLRLRGKTLEFSLRSPFDLMVNRVDHSSWLAFLNTVRTERFDEVWRSGPACRASRVRLKRYDRLLKLCSCGRNRAIRSRKSTGFLHIAGSVFAKIIPPPSRSRSKKGLGTSERSPST
jgi:hypothetical protein